MLGESLAALATALGAAVVQAAGTDAWGGFRGKLARLLGLGDDGRERVERERLDRTAAALEGPDGETGERERQRQQVVWETRVADLLESLPEEQRARFAAEVRALIEEQTRRGTDGGGGVSGNTFHGPTAVQTGNHNQQRNYFGRKA
ncbi:hypothetical protein [Streptomyces griseocarneus]|uniref:hypothetical protein n=1 Tax=Streptomyces griseocarneus TaxID=51201 RepID=UPI0019AE55CD|nr:hypothetical protein [Streptomyces griseocarneus]MBZ6476840.1 hypothetical protein [Streptomyces griseocarneus]GHG81126.1 hypothetical protein GCM10018779_63110 [Streptomyces griseocarneus]